MTSGTIAMGASRLHYVDGGSGSPVIVLHGFTGSVATMGAIIERLASRHRVVGVDLVGHGQSSVPASRAECTMDVAVRGLDHVIGRLGLAPVHLVAYSMGGRVALSYAVAHPTKVASITAIGASAGIADAGERADRVEADGALADRIEREGIEWFVDYWTALPILQPASSQGIETSTRIRSQRLQNDPASLSLVLRGLGTGSMPPLHGKLGGLVLPVLLIAGEADSRYRAIAAELAESIPGARVVVVASAGHAVHLDNPDGLAAVVLPFLQTLDAEARR